jgi:hypothetical protein
MAKTIAEKLGYKSGMTTWARHRPEELRQTIPFATAKPAQNPDILIGFVERAADVSAALKALLPQYQRGQHLWFAYPKKSAPAKAGRRKTDISRDAGWEPLGEAGLLPVTQIALDDTWSALRFRFRDEIASLTRKQDYPGKQS